MSSNPDPDRRRRVSLLFRISMLQQQILSEKTKVSNRKLARISPARFILEEREESEVRWSPLFPRVEEGDGVLEMEQRLREKSEVREHVAGFESKSEI